MSKQIAVVGNSDFVLGFNLAGVRRTYAADTPDEFRKTMERIVADPQDLAIVVAQSDDVEQLPPLLRKRVTESLAPVVVAMGEGAGEGELREKVKRAIGIDVFRD